MPDDPYLGEESTGEATSPEREPVVRIEDLSYLIRSRRWAEKLTLEEAAKKVGVSAATLSRWERGGELSRTTRSEEDSAKGLREPDTRTLAALTRWLGVSIDRVIGAEGIQRDTPEATPGAVDTLEIVEAHLRADRNLNSQSAELLANLFRVAYAQFSGTGSEASKVEEHAQETPTRTKYEVKSNSDSHQDTKHGRMLEERENETRE